MFQLFREDVVVLDEVMRQDETQVKLRRLLDNMREGAPAAAYDMADVTAHQLSSLDPKVRELYELPGQGTVCVFPTWEEAIKQRNHPILEKINIGYKGPSGERVAAQPVYRIRATNKGRHATKAAGEPFAALVASTFVAVGLQIRLTVNLFNELGQSWGLVNGSIGIVVEVLYETAEAATDEHAVPLVIAHFEDYCGPAFCPERPKLVLLPVVERKGDCACKCTRSGACFRVCEGTTVHSVEGITVGKSRQVKRIGISFGPVSVEHRARGTSYVASSRPETSEDYAYLRPVDCERLGAIGTGKKALELRGKLDELAAHQSPDATALADAGLYEPLLRWAELFAMHEHGVTAAWRREAHVTAYHRLGGAAVALHRASTFEATSRFFSAAGSSGGGSEAPMDVDPAAQPAEGEIMRAEHMEEWERRRQRRQGKRPRGSERA